MVVLEVGSKLEEFALDVAIEVVFGGALLVDDTCVLLHKCFSEANLIIDITHSVASVSCCLRSSIINGWNMYTPETTPVFWKVQ